MDERPQTIHYLQWLRALGAVGIVALHAFVTLRVAAPDGTYPAMRAMVEEVISIVCARWAVPVFFMMSGALMLDPAREMGWRKALRHAWRLLFILLTIGYAFCLGELLVDNEGLSLSTFVTALLHLSLGQSWDHMWYVYTLLGFYLMTPVIRPWFAQASKEELGRVSLVVCLLLLAVRGASTFNQFPAFYNVLGLPYCFAYYFAGYYVVHHLELNREWVVFGLASLALVVYLSALRHMTYVTEPIRGFVAPFAVLVMLLAKRYLDRPLKPGGLMDVLASYSFGIYLIHPVFQHLMVYLYDPLSWPAALSDAALFIVPLVLSIPTVWVLRRLPGFADKL